MDKIFGETIGGRAAVGLLILRLVTGAALMQHGWGKIQNPFHWMDAHGPSGMPGFLQFLAALSEFGGGFALVVGLLTPLATFGIICTMAVAILKGHAGQPWIYQGNDPRVHPFETASLYLIIGIALFFTGSGIYSLDSILFGKEKRISSSRLERFGVPDSSNET